MKKRIAALAVCLALALTACGQPKEAPATVGTIGTVDIPGGVYQLAQFSAYAEADSLTSEDNVLKAKLNVDGETVTVDHFGASAPAGILFKEFGFTVENVVAAAERAMSK